MTFGVVKNAAFTGDRAMALMLQIGSLGNVHTQTARAYKAAEMEKVLTKLAK